VNSFRLSQSLKPLIQHRLASRCSGVIRTLLNIHSFMHSCRALSLPRSSLTCSIIIIFTFLHGAISRRNKEMNSRNFNSSLSSRCFSKSTRFVLEFTPLEQITSYRKNDASESLSLSLSFFSLACTLGRLSCFSAILWK
jgi:hypothetical protein